MSTWLYILLGSIAMFINILIIRKTYNFNIIKCIILTLSLTIAGILGCGIMFFIETGTWGGVSFYGAMFFSPILMIIFALISKTPINTTLDVIAPLQCAMLSILKIRCYFEGCCFGRIVSIFNKTFTFPSQIVELFTSLTICIILSVIILKKKLNNKIYPLYMVLYGSTRFILNFFRDTTSFVFNISAGHFWSLIAVAIGILWLAFPNIKSDTKSEK